MIYFIFATFSIIYCIIWLLDQIKIKPIQYIVLLLLLLPTSKFYIDYKASGCGGMMGCFGKNISGAMAFIFGINLLFGLAVCIIRDLKKKKKIDIEIANDDYINNENEKQQ